jgi:hypothetical protein
MLIIRRKQMQALSQNILKDFEDRMILHLNQFFPDQCEKLGEEGTRGAIRYGFERARKYGLATESDLAKYLNLMFTFGRDFDTDPNLPWVAAILKARDDSTPSKRMARLYEKAVEREAEGRGLSANPENNLNGVMGSI